MATGRRRARGVLRAAVAVLCTLAFAASVSTPFSRALGASTVTLLDTPSEKGSQAYALSLGADGNVYLIWIEAADGADAANGAENTGRRTYSLKYSRLDGQRWSAPREISRGANWFVNWADHPSLTARADGTLLAHWLVNTGRKQGSYGYGVHVARSTDQGATWSTIFEDGMSNVSDYAGFLTFAAAEAADNADGADARTTHTTEAIYLRPLKPDDGSEAHGEHEAIKTLAAVSFGADGSVKTQKVVDADVCSCCSTDIALTANGPVAVYRDHLPGEIRDISIVRRVNGTWTEPAPVRRDGWKIAGCPTNGPALAARGSRVAVAWFTAAGETPRLKLALSDDSGATFSEPMAIDQGRPVGWPDLVMLDDGTALVSWLERRGDGIGEILVRRVGNTGRPGPAVSVAQASSGRATGMPHMIRVGDRLLLAWRNERVLTATVSIAAIQP